MAMIPPVQQQPMGGRLPEHPAATAAPVGAQPPQAPQQQSGQQQQGPQQQQPMGSADPNENQLRAHLGIPLGQAIPSEKLQAALSGQYGHEAQQLAGLVQRSQAGLGHSTLNSNNDRMGRIFGPRPGPGGAPAAPSPRPPQAPPLARRFSLGRNPGDPNARS